MCGTFLENKLKKKNCGITKADHELPSYNREPNAIASAVAQSKGFPSSSLRRLVLRNVFCRWGCGT